MFVSGDNLRRSSRIIARVRETSDSEEYTTPIKNNRDIPGRPRLHHSSSADDDLVANPLYNPALEKELETIQENVQRPKELFDEEDVSGNQIYGFRTPSKKSSMVQKAMECRTPFTTCVSEKLPVLKISLKRDESLSPKRTPLHRRRAVTDLMTSESESVSEESEFVPSDDDKSTSDDVEISDDNDDDNDDKDEKASGGFQVRKFSIPATPSTKRVKTKKSIAYSDFHLKTDEYFESQSEKILTSDRTLARLKNPRLHEDKLQELLKNQSHVSRTHTEAICKLTDNYRNQFPMWYFIMEEGFSLLLYGLGSKRNLINDFHSETISEHPTLVVNGFFPSLSIKDILDGILTELMGLDSSTNPNEAFNLIEDTLRRNPDDRLYLLIHNIDGPILRSHKAQDTISRLAAIPNVHLIASVDHINAPLLWDNVKRSRYNFYWLDATTMLPYVAETSYESSLLVQRSGALALSSLHNVFQSLTTNTKAIYILLVKHQLENGKSQNYSGMLFKDLYRGAREGFLVSSDLALRAQLTEFVDHKLVKIKRSVDGAEYLQIPLDNALLQQFLDQQAEH